MSAASVVHIIDHMGLGGAQRLLADIAPRQAQRGRPVAVVVLRGPTPLSQVLAANGVAVYHLGLHKWDPRQATSLYSLLRSLRPAVVHTHLTLSNLLGRIAAAMAGVEHVVIHDHEASIEIYTNPAPLLAVRRLVETRLPPRQTRYIVISRSAAAYAMEVRGWPEVQTQLIFNGVDVARQAVGWLTPSEARATLGLPQDNVLIACCGRLHPQKRIDVLLTALSLLEPRFHAAIAGDGPLAGELQALARRLGVEERVHFLGHMQDVRPVLWASDLYMQPSDREPFGLAAAEAAVNRLPVIASAVDGLRDVVQHGETGLLVPPGCPEAFAEAAARLAADPALAQKYGEAGRRRTVQLFSIEHMVERIDLVYDNLLGVPGICPTTTSGAISR